MVMGFGEVMAAGPLKSIPSSCCVYSFFLSNPKKRRFWPGLSLGSSKSAEGSGLLDPGGSAV